MSSLSPYSKMLSPDDAPITETSYKNVQARGFPWNTVVAAVYIQLVVILTSRYLDYLDGLTHWTLFAVFPMGSAFVYTLLGACAFLCAVGVFLTLVFRWGRISIASRVGGLLLICSMLAGIFGSSCLCFGPSGQVRFEEGFKKWVESRAEIDNIREWSETLKGSTAGDIDPELWPPCVKVLKPRGVSILAGGEGIRLYWGGGFLEHHYGLSVGQSSIPLQDPDIEKIVILGPHAYLFFPGK